MKLRQKLFSLDIFSGYAKVEDIAKFASDDKIIIGSNVVLVSTFTEDREKYQKQYSELAESSKKSIQSAQTETEVKNVFESIVNKIRKTLLMSLRVEATWA